MDIDVKNALNKLLSDYDSGIIKDDKTATDMLAKDIYNYISSISLSGSDERFNYFSKVYLGGKYKAEDFAEIDHLEPVKSLELLGKTLVSDKKIGGRKAKKDLAALFTALGRSYITNPFDKKYVDLSRSIDYINSMNSLIDADISETIERKTVADASGLTQQVKEKQESGDVTSDVVQDENAEPEESLEELLEQLDSLIGLQGVKKQVKDIINIIRVRKKGEEFGQKQSPLSLHLVFYGNPGTGKTTVARLLGKIYKRLGVLSVGQLVEVDRSGLVVGFVGQTATKTSEVIAKAMGGILFIDEAYTLTHNKGSNDFGQEAVDTILKAMEDYRDDLIVIVAGYPEEMKEFISSNPGLKSRFNQYIEFDDYSPTELYDIFCIRCHEEGLLFGDECKDYLINYFESLYKNKQKDFANGRTVRNYFEKVKIARANRLACGDLDTLSREEFFTITMDDLKEAEKNTKTI